MRILNRYILREFFRLMGLVLATLSGLYLIVEFFERVDDFVEHQAAVGDSLLYFVYKLPLVIYQVAPVAVLFPTILLINLLTRTGELTAIKSSGMSMFRLAAPVLAVSLMMSGLVFVWGDFVVGPSLGRLDYLFRVKIKGEGSGEYRRNNIWVKTGRNEIWNIDRFDPRGMVMQDVVVFSFGSGGLLNTRIDARSVVKEDGGWSFRDAYVRHFTGGRIASTRFFQRVTLPLNIGLSDLRVRSAQPEKTSFRELRRELKKRESLGLRSTAMVVDMHAKLSYPLASFVMVLLGIPFSLGRERGGKLSWGILLGITIGALYWVLFFAGVSLGHNGLLPPLAAAWGANILLSLTGVYMMMGARQ